MPAINFNGLASGLDTKAIVEQLTQIKKGQIVDPISTQLNSYRTKKTALTPIQTALSALRATAKALNDTNNEAYTKKKTDSSDTAKVKITATDSTKAVNGTYNITNIDHLAQPDRVIFQGVSNRSTAQLGTGTIALTYDGTTTNITIDTTNNTLDGIRGAINSANIGITASIINDGAGATPYRLVLTSNDTGADAAITQNLDSVLSLTLDPTSSDLINQPRDAAFTINSIVYSSATNTVADAIQGISFELLGVETTDTISLTVKQDTSAIIGNVSSFISSLNSARDSLKKAINPDSNNRFGPLGRDRLLQDAYYEVGRLSSRRVLSAGAYTSLAELGITADRSGVYTVDTGKLTTILDQDVSVVRKIFQGTTLEDGLAEKIFNYTDTLTNPIGDFADRQKQYDDSVNRLNKVLKDRTVALSNYQTKLKSQFNRLETTISSLKGQQDQITTLAAQISGTANNK
ncbi:MAG: flagellar filament capping protein FliD [Deltaproteobacteria bacterium]|nr:MAG: flagellar filament capping protein FliD [Deltaproteobacteria bacterium]